MTAEANGTTSRANWPMDPPDFMFIDSNSLLCQRRVLSCH